MYYSGKKKKHTLKTQATVNKKTKQIISTAFANGRCHDFRLFKESKTHFHPDMTIIADLGYIGIHKMHANSQIPKKRSKKNPFTKEDKHNNKNHASKRVLCENVFCTIKRFKIIADRYRNRRKRFTLRFNLIAGFYNFEL